MYCVSEITSVFNSNFSIMGVAYWLPVQNWKNMEFSRIQELKKCGIMAKPLCGDVKLQRDLENIKFVFF